MKRLFMLTLVLWPAISFAADDKKTTYQVVSVTDIDKETSIVVVSQEEYAALQSGVQATNRLLSKAVTLAKKSWESDKATKRKSFLSSVVSEAKIKPLGTFKTKADADAKAELLEKSQAGKTGKSDYLEKKLEILKESLKNPPVETPQVSRAVWTRNVQEEIRVTEDSIAKRKAKQGAREELEETIRKLIADKLAELLAQTAAGENKKQ